MDKVIDVFEAATPRDKIMSYLKSSRKGDIYLTPAEQEYMLRIDYVDDIIRNNRTYRDKEYINMIVEKFDVSASTARNLILDCKYIHGSTSKQVKTYERSIMTDCLWELYDKAKRMGEIKHAVSALELIAKINGYDKQEEEESEDGCPKTIIIRPVFAPETLGVPNPDNLPALIDNLRNRTMVHKKAAEALPEEE